MKNKKHLIRAKRKKGRFMGPLVPWMETPDFDLRPIFKEQVKKDTEYNGIECAITPGIYIDLIPDYVRMSGGDVPAPVYIQFCGVGLALYNDGTYFIEDTTGG